MCEQPVIRGEKGASEGVILKRLGINPKACKSVYAENSNHVVRQCAGLEL